MAPMTGRSQSGLGSDPVEAVLARLRAGGTRVTGARRLLLECLYDGRGHRTAEELAAQVQQRAPDVHLSTVYRNLDELERLGVVVHSHLGHGPATYHLEEQSHGHLVCEACGSTVEAPDDVFAGLDRTLRRRFGFRVDPHHFALLGTCGACAVPSPVQTRT
jgi:Fur family transcriptional regulator, ferric uptake regulator